MNAVSAAELQRTIVALVSTARKGVGKLGDVTNSIWANTQRLTPEARREDVAAAVREGRGPILSDLQVARGALLLGNADVDGTLNNLRHVPDEVLATRGRILSPILNGALERPEVLEAAYRRRFGTLADRRILEDSAEAVMDGLAGTEEGGAFAQRWQFLSEELAPSLPPAEQEALAHRVTLDGLGRYLDAAEQVVNFGLDELDPEVEVASAARIGVERAVAELNRYESENASALHGMTSSSS